MKNLANCDGEPIFGHDMRDQETPHRNSGGTTKKRKLRSAFHAAGLRLTRQRLAIYRELESRFDHPDVERLYRAVKPRIPQISLFTVYRTMNALEAAGMVWRVSTWKSHARYDATVSSHVHFLCESCGKLDDVETENRPELLAVAQRSAKGTVRRVDVMMVGRCEACSAAPSAADLRLGN